MTDFGDLLHSWESFYVIVGSSAAALTGLVFVVIVLMADHATRVSTPLIGAFSSPNVLHFCVALFISAVLSAPWQSASNAALALHGSGNKRGRMTGLTGFSATEIRIHSPSRSFRFIPFIPLILSKSLLSRTEQKQSVLTG